MCVYVRACGCVGTGSVARVGGNCNDDKIRYQFHVVVTRPKTSRNDCETSHYHFFFLQF